MHKKFLILAACALFAAACGDDDDDDETRRTTFTVRIENVSGTSPYSASGAFTTPTGASEPAPIGPGGSYAFRVYGLPGDRLSFATMFVPSNDLFFAPAATGVALYDDAGNPISGDITAQVMLWDAGTEVNQEPGAGGDQAPSQSGPNTGADENGTVELVENVNDGFSYPATSDVIEVTVTPADGNAFDVVISNVSTNTTLGGSQAVPMAPGVFVVHKDGTPLFDAGSADRGEGLEALAEDGDPSALAASLESMTGLATPFAPGVYMVHGENRGLFRTGESAPAGLEELAEDGDPAPLNGSIQNAIANGVFNTPVTLDAPAPIFPGQAYEFTFSATPNSRLSFATMLVQSNDLFVAPMQNGLALFDASGAPVSGDVTEQLLLWDAGTEVNQAPGFGPDQAPRQSGPNIGDDENGTVEKIGDIDDGFFYPPVSDVVKVTISSP